MADEHRRTVIFTLDAGDSDFVRDWAAEGRLPNIARIIDRGWLKTFSDIELANEMGSWPAVLSGISRKEFNYHHVRMLEPKSYRLRHTHSLMFQEPRPFWCHLDGSGKRALIFDPPDRDVYPDVPGLQIAHWTPHESERMPKALQANPQSLLGEFLSKYQRHSIRAFIAGSTYETDIAQLERGLKTIATKGDICIELIDREDFDLVVVGFNETHNLSHRLWHYQPSYTEANKLSDALPEIYAAIDREIGRILEALGGDPDVFILSTYGMMAGYPTSGLMNSFMENLGFLVRKGARKSTNNPASESAKKSGWESQPLAANTREFSREQPSLQSRLKRSLSSIFPLWMQERSVARELEFGTDWAKTRAYNIESLYSGLVRVNLKGREPGGIVERVDYDMVLDEIESELKLLVDPVTGECPIQSVVRTTEAYGCQPHEIIPDMFVEWGPARHFRKTVEHPAATLTQEPEHYHRSSWHSMVGFIAATGPSIDATARQVNFNTIDFAPTMLSLLGVPAPASLKGKQIEAVATPRKMATLQSN